MANILTTGPIGTHTSTGWMIVLCWLEKLFFLSVQSSTQGYIPEWRMGTEELSGGVLQNYQGGEG